mmetsp:Transcript_48335/g.35521  ORF Transcript_48335/g.35521 Transcript_48335/m.35521 type:complete len:147 (-) Transcript_48335:1219-1659(-)
MLTELIDKIDCNPELMMTLGEQLGKLTEFLGHEHNSSYLIKPLELMLSSDDSVVREKAVQSLKVVGEKIADATITNDFLPLVKRMRKGDIYSMRISAAFLYSFVYGRLDAATQAYVRKKFAKLAKDDTPMVRRGAAQSIALLAEVL